MTDVVRTKDLRNAEVTSGGALVRTVDDVIRSPNRRKAADTMAQAHSPSNPEAVAGVYRPDLLLKHLQRQGASGEEITAAAILSDQADNMERLALEMERWRQEAIRWEGEERKRASERDRMRAALERWSHDGRLQTFEDRERFRHEARELIGDRPAVETSAPQAPIAKVTVTDGDLATVELYAPGLPPGTHDLYCEPTNRVPPLKASETRDPLDAWRDMDSAPKDGTRILALVAEGQFYPNCLTPNELIPVVVRWTGEYSGWSIMGVGGLRPTLWQPIVLSENGSEERS